MTIKPTMMNFLKIAMLTLMLGTTLFLACKKSNDNGFSVEGSWQGKLGNGGAKPTGFIGLNIKGGHILERTVSTGSVTATGTWQIDGNTFSGNYVFSSSSTKVNLTGTLNKGQLKITGAWSNDSNEEGAWYVTK
jgi:hypothetical protein